jgi:hypothetical protein
MNLEAFEQFWKLAIPFSQRTARLISVTDLAGLYGTVDALPNSP